ncbi:type II secretion system protein [Candidatus Dojkabacteria bacterium]|uniref:Type II secretion system protein n=1 Tax=Candidatus Dojkabacteria bacterium TaxID=2099670 RepID=A0A955L2V1_9BACT|nr:type II secretion system protein [Candidatus Dojkabacteria bacterium]
MKSNKGFTLIELLIAMVIIGFLIAGVALLASNVQRNSRDTRRKQAAESFYTGYQDFLGNFNTTPTSVTTAITGNEATMTFTRGTNTVTASYVPLPGQTAGTTTTSLTLVAACTGQITTKVNVGICLDPSDNSVVTGLETGAGGFRIENQ